MVNNTGAASHTLHESRPPLAHRAVGLAAAAAARVRPSLIRLDVDEIIEAACTESGLSDFGSSEYREPLEVYVASLRTEARLTALGSFFARGNVMASLVNRLQLVATWTKSPEIRDVEIAAPWIVVGLPRSGSTLLQNLLAADPRNRTLMGWEAATPTPPPERATFTSDPRIDQLARRGKILDVLAPLARELHPVGPELPTECVTLMANSFASLEFASINWVPSFLDWCMQADMAPHYDFLADQLRLLQWRCSADRWVLKSPAHLFWVDKILGTFPDARLIWTHRDPLDVVPSFCSFSSVLCGIGSNRVDAHELGQRWASEWAQGLERGRSVRDSLPANAFSIDVDYPNLVADPIGVVRKIYDANQVELPADILVGIEARLRFMRQKRHASHSYSLEQFGLDPVQEAERFADFR